MCSATGRDITHIITFTHMHTHTHKHANKARSSGGGGGGDIADCRYYGCYGNSDYSDFLVDVLGVTRAILRVVTCYLGDLGF